MFAKKIHPGLWVVALLLFAGCGGKAVPRFPESVEEALAGAAEFELLSLDPIQEEGGPTVVDGFHGWKILGKTSIRDAASRKQVADALHAGDDRQIEMASCFWPRHGLKAEYRGRVIEIVVCFQCSQAECYVDGAKLGDTVKVLGTAQPALDEILKAANVPLPAKP